MSLTCKQPIYTNEACTACQAHIRRQSQRSTIKQKFFTFKFHREEEDEGSEGELDPSIELREPAKLLMIGDNQKADLFQGFLAKHFFRGMVQVSNFLYKKKL